MMQLQYGYHAGIIGRIFLLLQFFFGLFQLFLYRPAYPFSERDVVQGGGVGGFWTRLAFGSGWPVGFRATPDTGSGVDGRCRYNVQSYCSFTAGRRRLSCRWNVLLPFYRILVWSLLYPGSSRREYVSRFEIFVFNL